MNRTAEYRTAVVGFAYAEEVSYGVRPDRAAMTGLDARIPPLVVAVIAGGFMWSIAALTPALRIDVPARWFVSAGLATAGALIVCAGVLSFVRARTTVDPTAPEAASALVTTGIYRVSRNPMYVGFAVALLGWAVFLENPLSVLAVAAFVVYIDRFQITPEERALEARFGADFRSYTRKVGRWL
jgi:protein-S-isoprenylcysteine O-methyltransferase Ste14